MSQCFHLAIILNFWFAKCFALALETLIFHVLCGCETWSPILREERRLGVFEHRVPRRISGPRRDEVTGENYIMRSLMIFTPHKILFG